MPSSRWQQVNQLFYDALERPASARNDFLAEACAGDEALRCEVLELLAADEKSALVERPLGAVAGRLLSEADAEVETLMPVGSGIYVKANVPAMKKVIVSLGSGVTVEKSKEDALNFVEARIKEYDVAIRQLEAQRQEIAMRMEQLQQQLNAMLRQAQSG